MNKKILAFGASNSQRSINQQLANYAVEQLGAIESTLIHLNDFEMPVYGIDREKETGIPQSAEHFFALVKEHDGIVISFAEHNGNYTVAFKNTMDWASRIQKRVFQDKPMFIMSTTPGGRGGANVLKIAHDYLPYMGANVVAQFSLPKFRENFSTETGIIDSNLKEEFLQQLQLFEQAVNLQNV